MINIRRTLIVPTTVINPDTNYGWIMWGQRSSEPSGRPYFYPYLYLREYYGSVWLTILVFGLSQIKFTFRSQIDSLLELVSNSLTHNEIHGSASYSNVWKWVNLNNKGWLIFGQAKDSNNESTRPIFFSQCGIRSYMS